MYIYIYGMYICVMHVYRYISHVIGTKQVYIYIYLYTIGCCFQSMTESTSHGCFPGTPWGDKKYPCRFTVKNNHSSSRLLSTSCFLHFYFTCFYIQWEQRGGNIFGKIEPHPKQSCIFCSFEGKNKGNACLTSRRVKQSCTFNWLYLAGRRSRLLQQNAR